MKKSFALDELDCAHCGAKMEEAVAKLEGVKSVNVNFIAQKITLEADDEVFEDVLKKACKICRKIEPDCKIVIK